MAQYFMRISALPQILRRYGTSLPRRIFLAWSKDGWRGLRARVRDALGHHRPIAEFYDEWIKRYDTLSEDARRQLRADIAGWPTVPSITVLMPVTHGDPASVLAAIASCRAQFYPKWELRIWLGPSAAPSVREALLSLAQSDGPRIAIIDSKDGDDVCTGLNAALADATGEYFALLDDNDLLSEQALYWVAKEIAEHPAIDLIFSDEDRIGADGRRFDPRFKGDWNPGLMLSGDAFGRLGVYRTDLAKDVGGFRPEFAERYAYDLVLRCANATTPERIRHIPLVLYHRGTADAAGAASAALASTSVSSAWETGRRAIAQHLHANGVRVAVGRSEARSAYQVDYALPAQPVRVSILLPSRCEPDLIEPCLTSILTRTTYAHYDVLLVVNQRHRSAAEKIEALIQHANSSRVRLLTYPDRSFNYSWVNNWAARQAEGELLCFLNDDTIVITPDWLERLVARTCQPGVAAAGPMLRYPDDSIQHAGVILGLGGVAGHACHGLPKGDRGYLDRACLEQDVSCLTAACLMIRKDVFQDLGGFDEALPIAYNDVDLCLRVRQANWRLLWTPTVELYHRESTSVGRHDAPERAAEFAAAVAKMQERWGDTLKRDPCYNPNLDLRNAFHLAFPPRR